MNRTGVSRLLVVLAGAAAALQMGMAQAEAQGAPAAEQETRFVKTRSADDCHADLMRDWSHRSTGTGGVVRFRSSAETFADLIRDWDGPDAVGERPTATSRPAKAAYDDLVRNWGG
jgi:hypothetical protein